LSGIVVIDADDAVGLGNVKPYLTPGTLTATTGGGGKHYYFKHPGVEVPCAVRFMSGVDCRGDAGYVVVPPSLHKSGRRYRWENSKIAVVDIPAGLLTQVKSDQRAKLKTKDWETDIPDGERDKELTRRAGRLLQAGMSAGETFEVLQVINTAHCKPPLEAKQVLKIVKSIAGRDATKKEQKSKPRGKFETTIIGDVLMHYGEDEPQWTVDGWLPKASCGLVVAPPGSYKTWILTNLVFAVATGRPFLRQYPVTGRGSVLYIQQEDPFPMLLGRFARMFNAKAPTEKKTKGSVEYMLDCRFEREFNAMPIYWHTERSLNLEDKACMDGFEQTIAELKPALVTIDPLYSAVSAKEYMAIGAQHMLHLKELRDKYGCSFAIAHHTTVSGSSSGERASIWGSQFLNAWLEFGWHLPTGDEKGNIVIRHFKGSEDPKRIRVKFNITDFSFDVEIDEKPAESIPQRIEEMILGGGHFGTVRAVAEILECGPGAVHKAIKKMGLKKDEEGYYKIPPEEEKDE